MGESTRRIRLGAGVIGAVGAMALLPAGAGAATTTFGSSLDHTPANAGAPCNQGSSQPAVNCTHVGSFYPGFSGHAKARTNGKIVKIKIRPEAAMKFHFELVKVRNLSSDEMHGQARVIFQSGIFAVPGPTATQQSAGIFPVRTFPADIPVSKGDELAITTKNNQAEYCSDGTPGQLTYFNPILSLGHPFRNNNGVDGCLLLVQAVVKH